MNTIIRKINILKQDEELRKTINQKLKLFNTYKQELAKESLFTELCYCILTANCHAQNCINIQTSFPYKFSKATKKQIKNHLIKNHYRFPNIRTQYILEAQKEKNKIKHILTTYKGLKRRNWFVENIKGLGMKEASHYLRNIGYTDYAIIDTHIISILQKHNLINKPKTMTKKKYLELEQNLRKLAECTDLTLASLDLYLWYMQTGMILK